MKPWPVDYRSLPVMLEEMQTIWKKIEKNKNVVENLKIPEGVMFLRIGKKCIDGGFIGDLKPQQYMGVLEAFDQQEEKIQSRVGKHLIEDMPKDLKDKLKKMLEETVEEYEKGKKGADYIG